MAVGSDESVAAARAAGTAIDDKASKLGAATIF